MTATTVFLALALYQFLKWLWNLVRNKQIEDQSGILDLEFLGKLRADGDKIKGTAVICGGSLGGLAAARVCHDHFERVVIVEPEAWLSTDDAWRENVSEQQNKRKRLMQWETNQAIQTWGASCLMNLFPNLNEECAKSRISLVPGDFKISISGRLLKVPTDEYMNGLPKTVVASRPGFETLLRRLVIGKKQYPNIEQIPGSVIDIETNVNDPQYLAKVVVRQEEETLTIPATLVVDCTGYFSAGLKILKKCGFGSSEEDEKSLDELRVTYDQIMHYSTIQFPVTDELYQRFPEEARRIGPNMTCFPDSRKERKVIFSQIVDRNIVQLCAGQWGPAKLPASLDEFAEFAKSLNYDQPVPDWWYQFLDMLREVEDLITIKAVRCPPSAYTPLHRAVNMPPNWIALGDSIMRINPVFGQGINKMLLGVATLNTVLHSVHVQDKGKLPIDFAKRFFNVQAKKIEPIWEGVKGLDYDYVTTTPVAGETLSKDSLIRWYIQAVQRLGSHDDEAASVTWHSLMFLGPSIDFFRPTLVMKVLWSFAL
ncbi:hypothetical protein AMATHDRAFT_64243 [Amanita thiersii Skay4041]|uniref:FAD-binding domain-containing protein n=1 Tax=Amanita thiersii Skay4041 TaxID=703135 RepID=A0A2A9NMS0_9AGAR|nr:hypothetical protein AMATHDRAFT_64243 [Amanita thiersii Skay4041]